MDRSARAYTRALENRNAIRRHPPHDIFELQNQVEEYTARLRESREKLKDAIRMRVGATRMVTRPAQEGVYVANSRILVRHGTNGPSHAFWNVDKNASVYLKRQGREWQVAYGNDAGKIVQLGEHWAPGGLRK